MLAEVVNRPFKDIQAGVTRQPGDRFECTEGRMAEINSAGYGKMVVAVERSAGSSEQAVEKKPKPKKRKAAKEQ